MKRTAEIVVVGAGIAGSAIAYFLSRQGVKNLLLIDKNGVAGGATGYSAGFIRVHYANPWLRRLARRSWDIYMHWDEEVGIGATGFRRVGVVYFAGASDIDGFREQARQVRETGISCELLTPEQTKRLFPYLNVDDIAVTLFEPDAGYADGSSTAGSLVRAARELGATFVPNTQVTAVLAEKGHVLGVRTSGGEVKAPIVVIAAGGWSANLLRTAGVSLPITPHRMSAVILQRPPEVPAHPAMADRIIDFYCRPEGDSMTLADLGRLDWRERIDPDNFATTPTQEHISRVARHLVRRIPGMASAGVRVSYNAVDGFTPDGLPVLGPMPDLSGLYAACAFNGEGLKFGPVVGESMAELIVRGAPRHVDLSPFSATRFERRLGEDALITEYHPTPLR